MMQALVLLAVLWVTMVFAFLGMTRFFVQGGYTVAGVSLTVALVGSCALMTVAVLALDATYMSLMAADSSSFARGAFSWRPNLQAEVLTTVVPYQVGATLTGIAKQALVYATTNVYMCDGHVWMSGNHFSQAKAAANRPIGRTFLLSLFGSRRGLIPGLAMNIFLYGTLLSWSLNRAL
jgi:prepilin-type processing-associated H-X9-DG protein